MLVVICVSGQNHDFCALCPYDFPQDNDFLCTGFQYSDYYVFGRTSFPGQRKNYVYRFSGFPYTEYNNLVVSLYRLYQDAHAFPSSHEGARKKTSRREKFASENGFQIPEKIFSGLKFLALTRKNAKHATQLWTLTVSIRAQSRTTAAHTSSNSSSLDRAPEYKAPSKKQG